VREVCDFSLCDAASCGVPRTHDFPCRPSGTRRRRLIDDAIWPQDGCASIALPQWRRCDFLPLGFAHSSRRQESRCPAILRCAPALTGASSIACGLLIAIETAMVAGSDSQGETTWLP
jgi:hypothetical protein